MGEQPAELNTNFFGLTAFDNRNDRLAFDLDADSERGLDEELGGGGGIGFTHVQSKSGEIWRSMPADIQPQRQI